MRRYYFYIMIILTICSLTSCRTALEIHKNIPNPTYSSASSPNMDFIGFRNASRNNKMLQGLGPELERMNIVFNSQQTYIGNFDLQELSMFQSKAKYLAFVDIVSYNYSANDAIKYNDDLNLGAWLVAGLSAFTLFPVYVPMFIAANKNYSQIQQSGKMIICIYDTSTSKIIYTIPIEVKQIDMYKGEYYHAKTDKETIDSYYRQLLYNEVISAFLKAHQYISEQ